jgi:uncharacterized protein YceK
MKKLILLCAVLAIFSACGSVVVEEEVRDDQYWEGRLEQCEAYEDVKCEEATLREMEELR